MTLKNEYLMRNSFLINYQKIANPSLIQFFEKKFENITTNRKTI